MTDVVCDASIVLKWLHEEGEEDVEEARKLLVGQRDGRVTLCILDLTLYEIGNVLLRALGWSAQEVGPQLDDLQAISAVLAPSAGDLRLAARLAEMHELTFYDAVYAAVAHARGAPLSTADSALLAAGVGEEPAGIAARLAISETI